MHVRQIFFRRTSKSPAAGSWKPSQQSMIPMQTSGTIAVGGASGQMIRAVLGMALWIAVFLAYPDPAYPEELQQPTDASRQISDPALSENASPNHPPQRPEVKPSERGDAPVDLQPEFNGTPFSDGDQNDMHSRTQWRIEASGDGQVVMDTTCQGHNLTDLHVPGFVLDPSGSYRLQVRYFDQSDRPSPWSLPVLFSTIADPHDLNGNRIPDSQEISFFIDLNGDDIDDADQSNRIKTLLHDDAKLKLGLGIETGGEGIDIQAVANVNPSTLPEPFFTPEEMAYGLLRYKIRVREPGQEVAVIIYLSDPIDTGTPWLRYDSVTGWEDISGQVRIHSDGTRITRYVIDGGPGDSDGAANGIVVDQCGPLTLNQAAMSDGGSPAADGADNTICFIQTIGLTNLNF
jgi:hypothetical protein